MFDPHLYRGDFPILRRQVHGKPLIYLDNAATSQKPESVISAITEYYQQHNANVHRGVHQLGDESTQLFHQSRWQIAAFFGAEPAELVIVRNTTEACNQVAMSWGNEAISAADTIVVTEMEHHSNLVPWQRLATQKQAKLVAIKVLPDGTLDRADFSRILKEHSSIKLLALSHVSNTLGTLNPISELAQEMKQTHPAAKVFIDGAQAAPHVPISFKTLPVDFYAVSAHKMLGPMGMGAVLVKQNVLAKLSPWLVGGGMINTVGLDATTFADDLEERFTAGTPDVASLVGWAAACEYLSKIGMSVLAEYDQQLVDYALKQLNAVSAVSVVGPSDPAARIGSVTFVYQGVHAHDVGQILDSEGVAVRSGHHCTMPLHTKFGWAATIRASFQLYTTFEEVDGLITALAKVEKVFGV